MPYTYSINLVHVPHDYLNLKGPSFDGVGYLYEWTHLVSFDGDV